MSRINWSILNNVRENEATKVKTIVGGFEIYIRNHENAWLLNCPPFYQAYKINESTLEGAKKSALLKVRRKFEDSILDIRDMGENEND